MAVWLFGLPNSGKTTLARRLSNRLEALGSHHELLDGDEVRKFFQDTDYSPEGRRNNIRRVIFATALMVKHNISVVVANVLPFEDMRGELREAIPGMNLVYLKASLAECRRRDARKGALGGSSATFGRDLLFEQPGAVDLTLKTDSLTIGESLQRLYLFLGLNAGRSTGGSG